jgi:molecular chaperone GrpE
VSLQDPLAALQAELKEEEAKYLYLYADFDNFKKRTQKERGELLRFGFESAARELLQVIDNLNRALSHIPQGTDKNLVLGLQMVLGQFTGIMEKQGVLPITSLGSPFDPNLHEAITEEPSDQPKGIVIREEMKGYTLHGRLLRPARVAVSSGADQPV